MARELTSRAFASLQIVVGLLLFTYAALVLIAKGTKVSGWLLIVPTGVGGAYLIRRGWVVAVPPRARRNFSRSGRGSQIP